MPLPSVPAWQKVWNVASSAWCSERLFAWMMLAAALILGSHLRLYQLARWDMSGGRGRIMGRRFQLQYARGGGGRSGLIRGNSQFTTLFYTNGSGSSGIAYSRCA